MSGKARWLLKKLLLVWQAFCDHHLSSRWLGITLGSYLSTPTAVTSYDEFVPNEGEAVVQTDFKKDFPDTQKRD